MPILTRLFYEETNLKKTNNYIETGTYLGNGIKRVLDEYNKIYSIELSQKWYDYNVEQFKTNENVKMFFGDSKKVLPQLLNDIKEPVTIYLDAHYSGSFTEFGEEETPLLKELEFLKNREYDDIIIIDDCRLLGKSGTAGTDGHHIYPTMEYDWTDITEEKIIKLIKPGYKLLQNTDFKYLEYHRNDQYILVKSK